MLFETATQIKICNKNKDELHNYLEKVQILDFIDMDIQESTGYVKINTKGHNLNCFIKDMEKNGPFFTNERCNVILSLMSYKIEKKEQLEKSIVIAENSFDKLIITGNIVKKISMIDTQISYDTNHISYFLGGSLNRDYIIIDCGIYIKTMVPTDFDINVGDNIWAMGRIDIEKYRECLQIKINDKDLTCFAHYSCEENDFIKGYTYNAMLLLIPQMIARANDNNKEINGIIGKEEDCELSGNIVGFAPFIERYYDITQDSNISKDWNGHKQARVDCTIPINLLCSKYSDFQIGEHIKAVGRLDIIKCITNSK